MKPKIKKYKIGDFVRLEAANGVIVEGKVEKNGKEQGVWGSRRTIFWYISAARKVELSNK